VLYAIGYMKFLLILLLLLPFPLFAQTNATIVRVVDGDTVIVQIDESQLSCPDTCTQPERLRIVGIDTPEIVKPGSKPECYGYESSQYASAILEPGTGVRLELQDERDRYDRLLGYLYIGDTDYGTEMIENGYAYAYRAYDHDKQLEYLQIETQAREQGLGLWSENACAETEEVQEIVRQEQINVWNNVITFLSQLIQILNILF